jgi:D,D-heptose 1,7-bisphosphate phosphatase
MMEAIILAGGLGTRLREIVSDLPKPMAPVAGRPFLEILLTSLSCKGFERVVLSLGYMADKVVAHFGSAFAGIELVYEIEHRPLGTGGALCRAMERCNTDHVFVFNGDTYLDLEAAVVEAHWQRDHVPIIVGRKVPDTFRYGRLETDRGRVLGFVNKGVTGPGLINAGCYVLPTTILSDYLHGEPFSLESDFLTKAVGKQEFNLFKTNGHFIDIGVPKDYARAQTELAGVCILSEGNKRPAAFLDRDGVLNLDHGYVHEVSEFDWVEGARAAVKLLNDTGYLVILVTNQAGIGRGYYGEADFWHLTSWMRDRLAEIGAHVDGVYFCPHHPTEAKGALKVRCMCRKPNPGMIEHAQREWNIDMGKSFVIGDTLKDMELANAVNVPGYRFSGGNLLEFVRHLLTSNRSDKGGLVKSFKA